MKTRVFFIYLVYIFLFVSGSVFGFIESTIILGGESSWRMTELRTGITEVRSVRPHPVLTLSSATGTSTSGYSAASGVLGNFVPLNESALDLSVSFDEWDARFFRDSIGNYRVSVSPGTEAADRSFARAGTGAALFNGNSPVMIEPISRNALFAPGNRVGDFTIEFWLHPLNMVNGEQILSWSGSVNVSGSYHIQRISCHASRNRLVWSFNNFFTSTNGSSFINIEFSGDAHIVPKTWSHHLIRFDATTGMIEYIVDGRSESIAYATPSGREGGEVYTPVIGSNGAFLLGEHFTGLVDELKIHDIFAGRSSIQRYIPAGGRMETGAIDLGGYNSSIIRVEASGGRVSSRGNIVNNEFRQNGRFRFSDNSEMNFFVRSSEYAHLLTGSPWVNFTPGENIPGIKGRYVQFAVDFYPSADGETSPYLDELRIVFLPGEPPLPPGNLSAVAVDGGVLLRWRHSPDSNAAGYLIYYSTVRGEYFGNDALLGASPMDVGYRNNIFIDGLKNGTLYYFTIAAYDYVSGTRTHIIGEFSGEIAARPLAGLSLSGLSQ